MRYEYVIAMVREKQPKAILEVGTWNGERAVEMLNVSPKSKYYGFDLFEDATLEIDNIEKNVKAHYSLEYVADKLHGYNFQLCKGNTRNTLKSFNEPVDFVWLDGGHSVETIRSDWENVKRNLTPDAVVLFDDYYSMGPDTGHFGCNIIVNPLKYELVGPTDSVMGGGKVQIARVYV